MSINKKALTRYMAYDRCLRNPGNHTWRDLLKKANDALNEEGLEGIGKTQFYADIQYMEQCEWRAPIEKHKDGRTVYFRYADRNYSINNQPLNESEVSQLKSAISVLTRFKGMPQFEWINEVIPALETKLGLIKTETEIIAFENNLDYEGLRYISPLFNSIIQKKATKVLYQDFKSAFTYEIVFHPHYLKQFNNRWYAFGHNPDRNNIVWTLALDRIHSIENINVGYYNLNLDWDDYFDDFVGVTKAETPAIEIKLLILDAEQAAYIKTNPLHRSQKPIRQVENGFETTLKLIPNFELEKLILSFGERIQVVSPDSFRKRIAERIIKLAKLYT